jgi:DUF4097 and DUF4098 domain-containing protein YvlB
MNKDEIRRIMKLVQEGKLSPEDAAELIEAFEEAPAGQDGPAPPPPHGTPGEPQPGDPPPGAHKDPFASIVDAIEKIGRDVSQNVNWQQIADQVRSGVKQGAEAIRAAAKEGKFRIPIFGHAEERTVELPVHVPDGKLLMVENRSGDVRVLAGKESSLAIAKATIRGSDAEDARAKAAQYTLVVEESEHQVLIRQPDMSGLHVDLEIRLHTQPKVQVRSTSGDVTVSGIRGGCRVDGTSGDIRLSAMEGSIEITSTSGDVSVVEARSARLVVDNKSGDVTIKSSDGSLSVRTASGDVTLDGCHGQTVAVEAVSGDVLLSLERPVNGTVTVRAVQGDTTVAIPDGSNCRVALSTLSGEVACEVDLQDEAKAELRVTGRLGDGTGTLDVSAVSGDIRLTQRVHA